MTSPVSLSGMTPDEAAQVAEQLTRDCISLGKSLAERYSEFSKDSLMVEAHDYLVARFEANVAQVAAMVREAVEMVEAQKPRLSEDDHRRLAQAVHDAAEGGYLAGKAKGFGEAMVALSPADSPNARDGAHRVKKAADEYATHKTVMDACVVELDPGFYSMPV